MFLYFLSEKRTFFCRFRPVSKKADLKGLRGGGLVAARRGRPRGYAGRGHGRPRCTRALSLMLCVGAETVAGESVVPGVVLAYSVLLERGEQRAPQFCGTS